MQVEHRFQSQRFMAQAPSGTAVLAYRNKGSRALELFSTYVPEPDREKGVAGRLVEAAVAYARDQGMRIIPTCPYEAWWFRRHPEHAGLLAEPEP